MKKIIVLSIIAVAVVAGAILYSTYVGGPIHHHEVVETGLLQADCYSKATESGADDGNVIMSNGMVVHDASR